MSFRRIVASSNPLDHRLPKVRLEYNICIITSFSTWSWTLSYTCLGYFDSGISFGPIAIACCFLHEQAHLLFGQGLLGIWITCHGSVLHKSQRLLTKSQQKMSCQNTENFYSISNVSFAKKKKKKSRMKLKPFTQTTELKLSLGYQ